MLLKTKHTTYIWIVCATLDDLVVDLTLFKTKLEKNSPIHAVHVIQILHVCKTEMLKLLSNVLLGINNHGR